MEAADLALFRYHASRPEPELDLAQASLLIAEPEYPGLDVAHYLDKLDRLGADARRFLDGPDFAAEPPLRRITRLLHGERGFHGNAGDYYDPKNSFLNEVLDRKVGIPITLALVVVEVSRRAGVDAQGVAFPGHFLVRGRANFGLLLIDPFTGEQLDPAGLRALNVRATGEDKDPDPRLLEPSTKRNILIRMLNNLRGIYAHLGDSDRLRGVLARLQLLSPSEETAAEIQSLTNTKSDRLLN
jgi:regulator of sirC expression with transglutaminase-like and TPR domain